MTVELIVATSALIALFINTILWVITNNRVKAVAGTAAKEAAKIINEQAGSEHQKSIVRDQRIDDLPCIRDPFYQRKQGKMEQQLTDAIARLERIENKINGKS